MKEKKPCELAIVMSANKSPIQHTGEKGHDVCQSTLLFAQGPRLSSVGVNMSPGLINQPGRGKNRARTPAVIAPSHLYDIARAGPERSIQSATIADLRKDERERGREREREGGVRRWGPIGY